MEIPPGDDAADDDDLAEDETTPIGAKNAPVRLGRSSSLIKWSERGRSMYSDSLYRLRFDEIGPAKNHKTPHKELINRAKHSSYTIIQAVV